MPSEAYLRFREAMAKSCRRRGSLPPDAPPPEGLPVWRRYPNPGGVTVRQEEIRGFL